MRADVSLLTAGVIGKVGVSANRRVDEKVFDGGVNSGLPRLDPERIGVIRDTSIFDEIFKVRVGTTTPGLKVSELK